MGNSAKKKEAARIHNNEITARKAACEAERIDRKENPHKYRTSKLARHNARLILAAYLGMGVNSF